MDLKQPDIPRKLGVDVNHSDKVNLTVEKVEEPTIKEPNNSGLVTDWNRENPTKKVTAGDVIQEINGVANKSDEMIKVCKKSPQEVPEFRMKILKQPPKKKTRG